MEITWKVISGEGGEREEGTENKQHKFQIENRQGEVKNSRGNVDPLCMAHGHELKGGNKGGKIRQL